MLTSMGRVLRALGEMPRVQASYVESGGKRYRRVPEHVNLGIAIDVPGPKGRMLVVPSIKKAETLDFAGFYEAFQDLAILDKFASHRCGLFIEDYNTAVAKKEVKEAELILVSLE